MHSDPFQRTRNAGQHVHQFPGGLRLRHNKKISCQTPVRRPALPAQLSVPMLQHPGAAAEPVVKVGQRVCKGEIIAVREQSPRLVIHAPTSGTVEALTHSGQSHASGRDGVCVQIACDGLDQWTPLHPVTDWQERDPQELLDVLAQAGIAGLGGAAFPTHTKSERGLRAGIHTLILNGAECEPYISCDEMLMREQPQKIILGARILQKITGAERVLVAIEDQMGAVQTALESAMQGVDNMQVIRIPSIYPEGGERQLIQVLTGEEVPAGGFPADIGLSCQNVATAAAVADAFTAGKPLIERYVTVTGSGVCEPANLLALIGTPVAHLIAECGGYTDRVERLVIGGPMMGFSLPSDDQPVIKASNCLLALSADDVAAGQPEMPCIRCGECARVCPARLLPQELHFQIRSGQLDAAQEYKLDACIECGCCDFVCPSHIPLVDWFRQGKAALRVQTAEREAATHARLRFEAREARLERQQDERKQRMARRRQSLKDESAQRRRVAEAVARAANKPTTNQNGNDEGGSS